MIFDCDSENDGKYKIEEGYSYPNVGVAASGTFKKAASMSSWTTGTSGIPSGWTVQDKQ